MKILGLNFGHDAGVSLIVDGVFERHWEKERHVRLRHAMGLTADEILKALTYMDTHLDEIDLVAVTSTQGVPIMLFGDIDINRKDSGWPLDGDPKIADAGEAHFYFHDLRHRKMRAWSAEAPKKEILIHERNLGGVLRPMTLDRIGSARRIPEGLAQRMCVGLEVNIGGKCLSGAYVAHHLCHAYYAYSESQIDKAIVITADGVWSRGSFIGGGIFLGHAGSITPIAPHFLISGIFYGVTGKTIGLGEEIEASGKLMGLSAWGKPAYFDQKLVGNLIDIMSNLKTKRIQRDDFFRWLEKTGRAPPFQDLRECEVPPVLEADIAASAQSMFEQTMLRVVEAADSIARNVNFRYDAIVLGGGCALNCPANSLIYRRFNKPVAIPPAINDEGNSAGAALALHSLRGKENQRSAKRSMGQIAYKGRPYAVRRAEVEPFLGEMELVETDAAAYLAQAIQGGAVVGIFEKGAEIGPRALGHRSLVGSPLIADNWPKLNRLKGRELWRPLAPIVLPEEADRYFDGFPADSYYMLFNARTKTKALPAVTHVDGTARVQIASPDNGFIYTLLHEFKAAAGFGVLINTSFNARNEPIVETPEDALSAFSRMGFDFLYLDGLVLRREQSS